MRVLRVVSVGFLVALSVGVVSAMPAGARRLRQASLSPATFSCTGAEQTYSVPAGVHALKVKAIGAAGGDSDTIFGSAGSGGQGAVVGATVRLPAATSTVYVEVGCAGETPGSPGGGFNGGGGGGGNGGGGGGASDVRLDPMSTPLTTSDTRLVVAGGGGGGASCGNAGGAAGDSSVTGAGTGGNGSSTVDCKGGTAGGNGGFGGTAGGGAGTGQCGSGAGSLGQGEPQNTGCDPGYVGGAGGGGYYGGGAGADASGYAGGGGGAGSSFWVSGASHTSMGMNTTSLAPEVVITPLASEDSWKAGANKAWSASSPKTKFVSTAATITCTTNTASGPSVGSGPDIGALTMNAPKFSNCKDSLGDRATVTTKSSGWTVSFISDIGNAKCPAGSGKDETAGADCVVVGVPKDAATIVLGGVKACTIKVQPNGPTKVGAKATDPGGTTKDKIIVSSQRLSYKGCGVLSGKAKFSGTYTLKSPNSGVLVDKS